MSDDTQSDETYRLSTASAAALELPQLLAVIAVGAVTDLGRSLLLGLEPYVDEGAWQAQRRRQEEAERLLAGGSRLVPALEQPLAPLMASLASGEDVDGRDLVTAGDLVAAIEATRARIEAAEPAAEALLARLAEVPPAAGLVQEIRARLDGRGEVRDDASPALVRYRRRIHQARDALYGTLGELSERYREHLGEETIPFRSGRLVLVFQSGASGRVAGLTHGRSGSGKSVYFEPLEAVDMNNQLQQAVEDETTERRRILRELVDRVRAELPTVRAHAAAAADLDVLQAAVQFGEIAKARLAEPAPRHEITLLQARHPLLDPLLAERRAAALGTAGHRQPIMPLDLTLTADRRVLVVTGPNAGGKTVALKTVGLLAAAHQCALPIPVAAGSRLPFSIGLVATIGDDQDLLADRSTFSGRLLRMREAWDVAGPDSLVLLDELGSGTDPEEGAALSVALLETLVARGGTALITTHLTRVAAAALDLEGAFCAAMEFDLASGEPTYRLLPGPPGSSEALALGRRLGLPPAWLDRAEALLGSEHRDLHRLLAEIEADRKALGAARAELETEHADAERLRRRLAAQEAALAAERDQVAKNARRELDAFRHKTKDRLVAEIERVARELEAGSGGNARRRRLAGQAVQRLFEDAPAAQLADDGAGELEVGGQARHRRLGWQGALEKIDDRGEAQVRVSGKIFRCPADDLVAVAAASGNPAKKSNPKPAKARISAADVDDTPQELMLIGERVEPALERLDRFLDRALLGGSREVRVVHGHGTGRLRRAVREHLRRHRAAAEHRPGGEREGGDGATVVRLRSS